MEKFKETDLYEPIRKLLIEQGFTVRGEVKGCDIAASRDDILWVVEMKLHLNLTLILQAMERQTITGWVFIAIPRPKNARDKTLRQAMRLLKKIEIGLITVALDSPLKHTEILLFPEGKANKTTKASEKIRKEMAGRSADTTGGSTKTTINTAYRERCVKIACLLETHSPLSVAQLVKEFACERDTSAILNANFYGWFKKIAKARYELSPEGHSYLQENADSALVAYYKMRAI